MPWSTKEDVARHNAKAATDSKLTRQWLHVANGALASGDSEESAIRQANAVVGRRKMSSKQAGFLASAARAHQNKRKA